MKRFNSTKQTLRLETLEDRRVMSAYFELLEPFGGPDSAGYAVGSYGPIVGSADVNAKNFHAALWAPGMGPDFDLGTLGGPNSMALGINSRGTVVGWSNFSSYTGSRMAFKWSAESGMESLGFEGVAYGINAAGDVAGQTADGDAIVVEKGNLKLIPVSKASSQARAINNSGMAVGYAESNWSSANGHYVNASAFAWENSELTDLGTLGEDNRSEAYAVNAYGSVVGRSGGHICDGRGCVWTSSHGFLWNSELGMIDIGSLGSADDTIAYDINDTGRVVGSSNGHAFVYTQGFMFDLNDMVRDTGWTMTVATGINEQGWITGQATRACQTRAFLLIPDQIVIDPGLPGHGSVPADANEVDASPWTFGGKSKLPFELPVQPTDPVDRLPIGPVTKPICPSATDLSKDRPEKIPLGSVAVTASSVELDLADDKVSAELGLIPVNAAPSELDDKEPIELGPPQKVRPLKRRLDDLDDIRRQQQPLPGIQLP